MPESPSLSISRVRRVDHAAMVWRRDTGGAALAWTDRFVAARPEYREILDLVRRHEEQGGAALLTQSRGATRPTAFDSLHPLLLDLIHLLPSPDRPSPPPSPPPDAGTTEALANRLIDAAVEYQLATGDWYPAHMCCFREEAQREARLRAQAACTRGDLIRC